MDIGDWMLHMRLPDKRESGILRKRCMGVVRVNIRAVNVADKMQGTEDGPDDPL